MSILGLSATPGRSSVLKSDESSSFFNFISEFHYKYQDIKIQIKYPFFIRIFYLNQILNYIRSGIKLTDDDIAKITNSQIDIPDRIIDITRS